MTEASAVASHAAFDGTETTVPWERIETFVGQVSHDLRNGLNACELQLTFLAEIASDPEAAEEIKQLRQTLAGITKQLQSLRTAISGTRANLLPYPAVDLLEDLRERFGRLHPANAPRIVWKVSVDPAQTVFVDPESTLTACLELLVNALHFGDKQTPIQCAISMDGDQVACTVEQRLTEAPANPPESWGCTPLVTTRRGAYGLGLFRVRRILLAQGSRLTFQSTPAAQSLTATVTLPIAPESSPARP